MRKILPMLPLRLGECKKGVAGQLTQHRWRWSQPLAEPARQSGRFAVGVNKRGRGGETGQCGNGRGGIRSELAFEYRSVQSWSLGWVSKSGFQQRTVGSAQVAKVLRKGRGGAHARWGPCATQEGQLAAGRGTPGMKQPLNIAALLAGRQGPQTAEARGGVAMGSGGGNGGAVRRPYVKCARARHLALFDLQVELHVCADVLCPSRHLVTDSTKQHPPPPPTMEPQKALNNGGGSTLISNWVEGMCAQPARYPPDSDP